jgi:hypothetical protein
MMESLTLMTLHAVSLMTELRQLILDGNGDQGDELAEELYELLVEISAFVDSRT